MVRQTKVARHVHGSKWALGIVMVVFGLLITTQFRIQKQVPLDPTRLRSEELAAELKLTQDQLKAVEKDRDKFAAELDRLRKAVDLASPAPKEDTTPLQMMAGTLELKGPGVIVTLTESPDALAKARVQDEDLWLVLNELLAAGAEGIAVNGQRITSLSSIRNVGQRVMIYQTMTVAPFEIAAIGDGAVMEAALRLRQGVVDTLDRYGIKTTILRSEQITIPAFKGTPSFRYAKPAK